MRGQQLSDTIVAVSTGQGVAAISVIRLSGPRAIELTDKIFKGAVLSKAQTHTLHYGRIIDEEGNHLDDVVVGIYRGPGSYTSEDVIEISCHGSPYIIKEIINKVFIELLLELGCITCTVSSAPASLFWKYL